MAGNKPLLTSAVTDKNPKLGLLAVFGCNFIWGLLPLYWRALNSGQVPVQQIIAHRIVWSCLVVFATLLITCKLGALRAIFKSRRLLLGLTLSSLFVTLNWLSYVGMVNSGHVLEASLSTYIGPLATMGMGVLIFKDKLECLQWLAMAFAAAGVVCQVYILGYLPWAVVGMTVFGACYGLLRTVLKVDAMPGLFVENLLAMPLSIAIMLWWHSQGALAFMRGDAVTDLLVLGTGVITAFPMMWLVFGMRNASYTSVGLVNYISPTMIFFMGVFVFEEQFTGMHLFSFILIWAALALYTIESLRQRRNLEKTARLLKVAALAAADAPDEAGKPDVAAQKNSNHHNHPRQGG